VDLVKTYLKEYEALEPLIYSLKNILKNSNLNDPYTGGLSSYGLILMIVSFLQSQLESKKPIKITDNNLGRLFLEFLWYYGIVFDHSKYVIYTYAPNDNNPVDKESVNLFFNMQPNHELIIVDPLNKQNNVARSTYQFVNIKMGFMISFVVSHEECECGCHFNKICDDNIISNTEHCILKRIFNSVKRFNVNNTSQ
jgi:non-canonical poly(A) RNA polymerase PAPD5/7